MKFLIPILIMALAFGLCFLVDKAFTRLFRSKSQHKSGLAVRPNKRYVVFGVFMVILGLSAIFTGLENGAALLIGGIVVLLMGLCLAGYYVTHGIFYDDDSFLYTSFGRKSITYRFSDIQEQRLFIVAGGAAIVELHLSGGKAVSIHTAMEGAYAFLDHAFAAWCRQTGRDPESCDFHDPATSRWFPNGEDE